MQAIKLYRKKSFLLSQEQKQKSILQCIYSAILSIGIKSHSQYSFDILERNLGFFWCGGLVVVVLFVFCLFWFFFFLIELLKKNGKADSVSVF